MRVGGRAGGQKLAISAAIDWLGLGLGLALPPDLQKAMDLSQEMGASNWLTTLPVEEFGFCLHKGAF